MTIVIHYFIFSVDDVYLQNNQNWPLRYFIVFVILFPPIRSSNGMDLENWMGCIKEEIKDKKLSEIVIPGSHDSGSYCINRKSKYDS